MFKEYCQNQIRWLEETCAEFRSKADCEEKGCDKCGIKLSIEAFRQALKFNEIRKENAETIEWIKVKFRPVDEDERGQFPDDELEIFDCKLPDDGEGVLVQTIFGVSTDIFCNDGVDGCGGEKFDDWHDVIAWATLPKGI